MIEREGGRLVLSGRLTIATVPALFETGLRHLDSEDLLVDFSAVEAVDSSAVSMLLGWLRAAHRQQRTLRVSALPEDLLSLARLYGVADMLPQAACLMACSPRTACTVPPDIIHSHGNRIHWA